MSSVEDDIKRSVMNGIFCVANAVATQKNIAKIRAFFIPKRNYEFAKGCVHAHSFLG